MNHGCFILTIISCMCSCSLSQQEVYGLSCILRRLATTFSAKQFSELGVERLELLVRFLAQLTCLSAQKTALEEVSMLLQG